LSYSLINTIAESEKVKRGLLGEKGANVSTSEGGGQPKTYWHWDVAKTLFAKHPDYCESFAAALLPGPKGKANPMQAKWGEKVKNRLAVMNSAVRKYCDEMGKTGEGLRSGEEIDKERNISLFNKWEKIKKDCPWFFEMRDLVGERPNRNPVGIGNSTSEIDVEALEGGEEGGEEGDGPGDSEDDEDAIPQNDADTSSEPGTNFDPLAPLDIQEDVKPVIPAKRKPSMQAPPAKKAKLTGFEHKFVDVATAEETTEQRRLEIEKVKIEGAFALQLEREKTKVERERIRTEAKLRHKEEKRRYKLEKLRLKQPAPQEQSHGTSHHGQGYGALIDPSLMAPGPSQTNPYNFPGMQ
ncbi:hypothetical protein BKA70DRAFT_1122229, partial [Coprinopsis sp. MPI-PUGE-AT-0042]